MKLEHCPHPDCPLRASLGRSTAGSFRCSECGLSFVDGVADASDAPSPAMPADGRVETIAITRNAGVTFFIQGLLEGAGIPSFVSGAESARTFGGLLRTRILVPSEQADEARELLRADVDAEDFEAVPTQR